MLWTTGEGETSWETRAARKIRKKARNKTPKSRSKSHKTNRTSNPKESLDGNHAMTLLMRSFAVLRIEHIFGDVPFNRGCGTGCVGILLNAELLITFGNPFFHRDVA